MIVGIGQDLIEIQRVLKALNKDNFRTRCFTSLELDMANGNDIKLVDNFAVKEAVSKVLGTGFRTFMPKDIEVLRDTNGKPYVNLYGNALEISNNLNITNIFVSISNTKDYTTAVAIGERIDASNHSQNMEGKL